jgi:mycofactocin precursor
MDERDEQVETADVEETAETEQELVVADELLVEDVSIDGMCGVY